MTRKATASFRTTRSISSRFGEYEPFPLIHRVVNNVSSEVGGFRKGTKYSVGQFPNGNSFGVFICYEAIYPGEIRRFAANGAQLFVNISNDGWFGHSAAAEQHLRMARVRAVENRRWIVRTTNSGITASIDPYGRIFRPLPARRARRRRFALRLPHGQDPLHALRRLVRLALRAGFRYPVRANFQKGSLASAPQRRARARTST